MRVKILLVGLCLFAVSVDAQRIPGVGRFVVPRSAVTCDQTFSNTTGLATAIGNAANNTTICLNAGAYGSVNLFDMSRTGFVTIYPSAGAAVTWSPQVGNTDYVRFNGSNGGGSFTFTNVLVNSCSTHIEFLNIVWTQDAEALYFEMSSCPSTQQFNLVDGNVFYHIPRFIDDGMLECRDCNTFTVKNSTFEGVSSAGSADGFHTLGGAQDVTVGPNNLFKDILQATCSAVDGGHCDSIQIQGSDNTTITGNFFRDVNNLLQNTNGTTTDLTFTNNVATGTVAGIQIGTQVACGVDRLVFTHNTFYQGASLLVNSAQCNAVIQNNLLVGTAAMNTTSNGGCTSCTISYNLCDNTGCVENGTNEILGTPTFVGGSPSGITTLSGWALDAGSVGENAGHDGTDVGTLYYGP